MNLIGKLQSIIDDARSLHESSGFDAGKFDKVWKSGNSEENMLVKGENFKFLKYLDQSGYKGKIKLIYIDPPFFSKADYDAVIKINPDNSKDASKIKMYAYQDTWASGMEDYLRSLCDRLFVMKDLLSDDGSIWVHIDWHAAHYVKILMDEIFGEKNFVNEIIWNYKSGGTSKRHFSRKHDTILFYSKTNKYYFNPQTEKSYNRKFKQYRFKGVDEYKDDIGWYTMVNMKDVWQIDMVGRTSAERTGYATQKPEALLERIVESCSQQGDICADFFGGSGTMAYVCNKMGRKWISCDFSNLAFSKAGKRLLLADAEFVALRQNDELESSKGKTSSKVNIETSIDTMHLSNDVVLKVKLTSYSLDVKKLMIDESAEKVVKKAIKSDSLGLIEYWSIDFNFDGNMHKSEMIFIPSKDKIYECEKLGRAFGAISVHVVDVFGNSTFEVIEIKR